MPSRLLKILFFGILVRPIVLLLLGLHIVNRKALPLNGPAVIAANHNSHLDTLVLMSLFPLSMIHQVRPVAAADYFFRNRALAWFSLNIIGIIPLQRQGSRNMDKLFARCHQALDQTEILIIFPEGTRGRPEQMGKIKKGLYYLLKDRTDTEITPVIMRGLGQALPRGEALFVPFNCDVVIGEPLQQMKDSKEFIQQLAAVYGELAQHCLTRAGAEENEKTK
ncbi:MAG: 1-acyl-sn-glycerol-3-phosphate acyltransferase [Candidatus Electrothrix sp. EH2]|nr:1-acyl-sn-glycerol-3-phosphate acyltransferase [Candidatus Electrothrix sp. EH2]